MPRIIKRTTVTEELLDDRNLAGLQSEDDDSENLESEDGTEEDSEQEQPERRRRR